MACKYIYEGQLYTRPEMLRLIVTGGVSKRDTIAASRKWLETTLGLNESQVEEVKGLIEGKAIGRMLKTGKILLSNLSTMETAQEEGFHYFFDFLATESEQVAMWQEMSDRPYAKEMMAKLRESYPDYSDTQLMKEILAKDFVNFVKTEGAMILPETQRSFFERLIDFIKTMLGLNQKDLSLNEIYASILAGKYRSRKPFSFGTVDELDSRDKIIPITVRGEIAQNLATRLFQMVVEEQMVAEFAEGRLSPETVKEAFMMAMADMLADELMDVDGDLAAMIVEETTDENDNIRETSELFKSVQSYLSKIGFRMEAIFDEDSNRMEDLDEVNPETEAEMVKDRAFNKVSFEFDPRADIRRTTAVLLNSVFDPKKTSQRLGLQRPISYNEATGVLFQILNGIPANWSHVKAQLEQNYEKHPWLEPLVESLNGDMSNPAHVKLTTEFVLSFTKNKYRFTKALFQKGRISFINLASDSTAKNFYRVWGGRVDARSKSKEDLVMDLARARTPMQVAEVLGMDELEESMLGFALDEDSAQTVAEKLITVRDLVLDGLRAGVQVSKIFNRQGEKLAAYEVRGSINQIAQVVARHGRPLDLMLLSASRKRIYSITIHNYQTQIVGALNWIARTPGTFKSRLEMFQTQLPHLNTKYLIREDGSVRSTWLRNILNGIPLTMEVFDGAQSRKMLREGGDVKANDMLSFHVNAIQEGRMFSFKHGDRSTIFAYQFEKPHAIPARGLSSSMEAHVNTMITYLDAELEKIKLVRGSERLANTQNWSKRGSKATIFSFLPDSEVEKILKTKWDNASLKKAFGKSIRAFLRENSLTTRDAMAKGRLLDTARFASSPAGIDEEIYKAYLAANDKKAEVAFAEIALNSFAEHFYSYVEQTMIFTGDPANYKSAVDFYKRIQMQSSTGTPMAVSMELDDLLTGMNERDTIQFYGEDPVTYGESKIMGYQSEVVLDLPPTESKHVSVLKSVFEAGIRQDMISQGFSIEEALKKSKEESAIWAAAYEKYDENDGQSYINIFYWREYETRQGTWSEAKENTFQLELATLSAKTLSATTVWVNPENRFDVSAKEREGFIAIRAFNADDVKAKLELDYAKWFDTVFDYGSIKKPQYVGPLVDLSGAEDVTVVAGRKTSYATLMPSVIRGTKLELLNKMMLRQGVDSVHMTSGAKYGNYRNPAVPSEAYSLYQNGEFAPMLEEHMGDMVTYLDIQYMKDQLAIHNRPKSRIKNATQSAKIIFSNLFSGGVPKDYAGGTPFLELAEDAKIAASEIYRKYKVYSQRMADFIESNIEELMAELGANRVKGLGEILKKNAKDKEEASYIQESINLFVEQEGLEFLPNWQRIESLLYSIVSNNVISLNRPGDGKAQFASTMWEKNDRDTSGTNLMSDDTLKFYQVEQDENGNVTKIHPAECIIPLDPKQINWLLNWSKKSNLVEALDWYEGLDDDQKIVFKGLRIPNQQLSFNEVLRVKRFAMPTLQSYIVLPSEVVVKAGSDFDVDKIQMYMPVSRKNLTKNEALSNALLEAEIDLMLDPNNAHNLLAPSTDEWLKEDVFNEVTSLREKISKDKVRENRDQYVVKVTDDTLFSLPVNVTNSVLFLESKKNVGLVATGITSHNVAQADKMEVGEIITLMNPTTRKEMKIHTALPFPNALGSFDAILDRQGNAIVNRFSSLLTSQVDALKDNYAAAIELTERTIPLVMYLMRRGISAEVAIKFVNAPIIKEYLAAHQVNNSLTLMANRNLRVKNTDLPAKMMQRWGMAPALYFKPLKAYMQGKGEPITEAELDKAIKANKVTPEQAKIFAAFMHNTEVLKAVMFYMRDMTADTKSRGNRDAVISYESNFQDLIKSGLIPSLNHRSGFLAPAYKAQGMYRTLFQDLYVVPEKLIAEVADPLNIYKSFDEMGRIRAKVSNDFVLFILQNYHPKFKEYTFERLFVGPNSIAREILDMRGDVNVDFVLSNLLPLLNEQVDPISGRKVDFVKVTERGASTQQLNDLYEAFSQIPVDLQEKLMFLSLHQAGLGRSPFSLDVMLNADLLSEVVEEVKSKTKELLESDFDNTVQAFRTKFYFNNPSFLPNQGRDAKETKLYSRFDETTNDITVIQTSGRMFYPLGNQYYMRYQLDVEPKMKLNSDKFDDLGEALDPETEEYLKEMFDDEHARSTIPQTNQPTESKLSALRRRQNKSVPDWVKDEDMLDVDDALQQGLIDDQNC